jgi:hypothetical protein
MISKMCFVFFFLFLENETSSVKSVWRANTASQANGARDSTNSVHPTKSTTVAQRKKSAIGLLRESATAATTAPSAVSSASSTSLTGSTNRPAPSTPTRQTQPASENTPTGRPNKPRVAQTPTLSKSAAAAAKKSIISNNKENQSETCMPKSIALNKIYKSRDDGLAVVSSNTSIMSEVIFTKFDGVYVLFSLFLSS